MLGHGMPGNNNGRHSGSNKGSESGVRRSSRRKSAQGFAFLLHQQLQLLVHIVNVQVEVKSLKLAIDRSWRDRHQEGSSGYNNDGGEWSCGQRDTGRGGGCARSSGNMSKAVCLL